LRAVTPNVRCLDQGCGTIGKFFALRVADARAVFKMKIAAASRLRFAREPGGRILMSETISVDPDVDVMLRNAELTPISQASTR
jgi:hypothetical protein